MRKHLLLAAAAILLSVAPASAQNLTFFMSTAWLDGLAQAPTIRILAAQSSAHVPMADVNAFNDFYLINGPGRLQVHFNYGLQNLGQKPLPGWVGQSPYSNHQIFADIQTGFNLVKAKFGMPNARAGNVTVYKTTNTNQIVYSYAVSLTPTVCQQYLYTPATGNMQIGLRASCYWSLFNARRAGPRARM
jgi:hypothetical protein